MTVVARPRVNKMMNVMSSDPAVLSVSRASTAARRTMIAGNSPREPPMIPSTAAAVAAPGRFGPPSWGCAPYRGVTCQDGAVFWRRTGPDGRAAGRKGRRAAARGVSLGAGRAAGAAGRPGNLGPEAAGRKNLRNSFASLSDGSTIQCAPYRFVRLILPRICVRHPGLGYLCQDLTVGENSRPMMEPARPSPTVAANRVTPLMPDGTG